MGWTNAQMDMMAAALGDKIAGEPIESKLHIAAHLWTADHGAGRDIARAIVMLLVGEMGVTDLWLRHKADKAAAKDRS